MKAKMWLKLTSAYQLLKAASELGRPIFLHLEIMPICGYLRTERRALLKFRALTSLTLPTNLDQARN